MAASRSSSTRTTNASSFTGTAFTQLKTPPPIALQTAQLVEYDGCYRAASDLHYRIATTGGRLTGGITGRTMHPLLAEVAGVFFVMGQPRIRMIFRRDRTGKVSGYLSRREGNDIVWTREADHSCRS